MTTTPSPEYFETLDVVVMTSRPGCVRAVLDVELPRPQTLHVRELRDSWNSSDGSGT